MNLLEALEILNLQDFDSMTGEAVRVTIDHLNRVESERDNWKEKAILIYDALEEVVDWIKNWESPFLEDLEWQETETKVNTCKKWVKLSDSR